MSDQEENDHNEAFETLTGDIGNRILQGSEKTKSLSSVCIYRVPKDLRSLNESAYTPRLITIGPLHRNQSDKQHGTPMQHVKRHYVNYLFFRVAEGIEDKEKREQRKYDLLRQCVKKMKELVDQAKKCYAEEGKVKGDDEMAEMMLIDGCFILELLYASYHDIKTKEAGKSTTKGGDSGNSKASRSDPIIDHILTAKNIKHDLLLLENQIPFFVLEELFKLTVDKIPDDKIPGGKKLSLTEYVISYFGDIMISPPDDENSGSQKKTGCSSPGHCVFWVRDRDYSKENEPKGKIQWEKREKYDHILHLLHRYYGPGDQWEDERRKDEKNSAKKFRASDTRASELDYGGVKFVPVEKKNLFDVEFRERKGLRWWFHSATFDIPTLIIRDHTETFLRNLIVYEQLHLGVPRYFTFYAKLMDVLINSEKDFQVLTNAKVIENYLDTDKDVFYLFNNLCKEIVTEDFYFRKECEQAFNFTKRNWWPKFSASLRRCYFGSPWQFIGICLAYVGFGMQVMQFMYDYCLK